MTIQFKNVIPNPLLYESFDAKSVWDKSLTLDCSKKYLLTSNSGKGKSSFISFLFGARLDYSGEIIINNQNWKTASLDFKSIVRSNDLSILTQDMRLFGQLTALQNLEIQNDIHKVYSKEGLVAQLTHYGLQGQINQTCSTLSLGQQQRVALIRSLIRPFKFLVLDEPFSHLDEGNIKIGVTLIKEACAKHKAGLILASLGPAYGIEYHETIYL